MLLILGYMWYTCLWMVIHVHTCGGMHTQTHACLLRPEVDISYISQSLSTLFFETALSLNLQLTDSAALAGWLMPRSSLLDLPCTGITGHTTKPSFCVGAGDLRLSPRVLRQAVYQRASTVLVTVVLVIVTGVLIGKSCRSSLYQLYQQYSLPPTAPSYPQSETQARPEAPPTGWPEATS